MSDKTKRKETSERYAPNKAVTHEMTTPPSRQQHQTNAIRSLVKENANEDELCVVLDSDDSSGSEAPAAYGSAYKLGRVSQKITLYEDLSCRDESEGDFSSPRRSPSKGQSVSRKVCHADHELQASSISTETSTPLESPTKDFIVSPVKAIERAKRTKIWEKASLYEKSSKAQQQQPLLSSPRRKALPEALQPVLNVFEGRGMYKKDDNQRASVRDLIRGPIKDVDEGGCFLELNDGSESVHNYDDSQYNRQSVGDLKTTLQKFEKLSQLAKKKKDIENQIRSLGRKAKRRGSAGNGTMSGKSVEEKMMNIDKMFLLHHTVTGTEIGSLAAMQTLVKKAHHDDFEKQVRAAKKKELLDRYETNILMEKVQRKLQQTKEMARQMMDTSDLVNNRVVQGSLRKAEVFSGKMSRRQTIARSMHVVTEYTRTDNAVVKHLRHEYQRQSLGIDDHLYCHESCGSLPAILANDNDDRSPSSLVTRGSRTNRVSGLRPGMHRGDSYGHDLNNSDQLVATNMDDDAGNYPRKSHSHRVSGLRPGMQRGDSYGHGLNDSFQQVVTEMDNEAGECTRKSHSYSVSGLRPGMQRGDSYGHGLNDSDHQLETQMDDDASGRSRKSHVSGLRPGMQRGDSNGRGLDHSDQHSATNRVSGLRPGMQRGDSYGGLDDTDHQQNATNVDDGDGDRPCPSRSHRVSGLRPGMQRGDSYDNGLKDSDQQVAINMDDGAGDRPRPSRSHRVSGLRPGMQRGDSYDHGLDDSDQQHGTDVDDEVGDHTRKSRTHYISGLRPGMQRGDSYGHGLSDNDLDNSTSPVGQSEANTVVDNCEATGSRRRSSNISTLRPGMQRGSSFDDDADAESVMNDSSDSLKNDDPSLNSSMELSLYTSASELNKSNLHGSSALCFSPSYGDSMSAACSDSSAASGSSSDYSSSSDANKRINALLNKTSKYLSEHGKQATASRRIASSKGGDRDDKKKRKDKRKKHDKSKKISKDDEMKKKKKDKMKEKRKEKKKSSDI